MLFHVNQNADSMCEVETGMRLCRNKGIQGGAWSFFAVGLTTSTCVSIFFFFSPEERLCRVSRAEFCSGEIRSETEGAEKDTAAVIHLPGCFPSTAF